MHHVETLIKKKKSFTMQTDLRASLPRQALMSALTLQETGSQILVIYKLHVKDLKFFFLNWSVPV